MRFDFDDCRRVLIDGMLDALRSRTDAVKAIERTGRGDLPVTGVSLDLAPWHGGVGLALRQSSDPTNPERRYSSVEWKLFNFVSDEDYEPLAEVGQYIRKVYRSAGRRGSLDAAHLIFLAGADALLDKKVAAFFRKLGVDAPVIKDRFVEHYFEYIVIDPDGTIRSNYCDLVLAMQVSQRLLGRRAEPLSWPTDLRKNEAP